MARARSGKVELAVGHTLWPLGDTLTALTVTSSPTLIAVLVALSSPRGAESGVYVGVGGVRTSMVIESRTSVWPLCLVFKVTLPLPGGLQPSSRLTSFGVGRL